MLVCSPVLLLRQDKPPQHGRRLSLEGVSSHSNTYIFVLPNSLELETEFKLRLSVLKKGGLLASAKKPISFQYIGMFAGRGWIHRWRRRAVGTVNTHRRMYSIYHHVTSKI